MALTTDEAKDLLKRIEIDMQANYSTNQGRLGQLSSALSTASMALDHLYDEEVRESDLVARVGRSPKAAERHGHQLRTPPAEEEG